MRTGVQHRGFVPVSVVELLLVCLEGYCKWNRLLEWKTDWWHQSQQLTIGLKLYCCIILIKKRSSAHQAKHALHALCIGLRIWLCLRTPLGFEIKTLVHCWRPWRTFQ